MAFRDSQRNIKKKKHQPGSPMRMTTDSKFNFPLPVKNPISFRRDSTNSGQAFRRMFSIFSFSSMQDKKGESANDLFKFEDSSSDGETDSVLSDVTLSTQGAFKDQEEVGTMIGRSAKKETFWAINFHIGCEQEATNFLYKLINERQRRDREREDIETSNTRFGSLNSELSQLAPKATSKMSANSTLLDYNAQSVSVVADPEVLKLDLFSVLKETEIGVNASAFMADLLWNAFGFSTKNEVSVAEVHIVLRYFFQLAKEKQVTSLAFQMLNSSRSGIMSIKEVNEFVAYACSHSLDSLVRIPAALKLFKRYMKSVDWIEHLDFYLEINPFLKGKNSGFIRMEKAFGFFKLFFEVDAAYGISVPTTIQQSVRYHFSQLDKTETDQVPSVVFEEASNYVKKHIEKVYLPKFVKKVRHSNRLATKMFRSIRATPVPGLEAVQFEKLLEVCAPLKEYCERCVTCLEVIHKSCKVPLHKKGKQSFNEIGSLTLKRRIPL